MQEIANGVIIETGLRGVTLGAIRTSEGYVLIDTPSFQKDAKSWRATLQAYADIPIRAIIVLDSHRDRMLGASWFDEATLISHAMTRDTLFNLSQSYISTLANMLATNTVEHSRLLKGRILLPAITFSDRMRLHFGETTIILEHRPGPSSGSLWVVLEDQKVIFVGDSLVEAAPPYLGSPFSGAWLEGLDALEQKWAASTIVSGRGAVAPVGDIERLRTYLGLAREKVKELYETRRPLSEMSWLIHRLMTIYPAPLERDLSEIQQRVRTGLQFIYNEFREEDLERSGRRPPQPSRQDIG